MKKRIRFNIYGNWNGYEGSRKVIEFGLDDIEALAWLHGITWIEALKLEREQGAKAFGSAYDLRRKK